MRSISTLAKLQKVLSEVGAASFLTAPTASPLAPGRSSGQLPIRVPESGWLLQILPGAAVLGGTLDQNRDAANQLAVRIRHRGEDLFTDGTSGQFVEVQRFVESRQRFNFVRRFTQSETVLVEFRNDSQTLTIRPSLLFALVSDRKIAEYAAVAEVIG